MLPLTQMANPKKLKIYHPAALLTSRIHRLEYDPVTQFKFNFFFTWLWCLAMIALPFFPKLYNHSLAALIIQELSIWALFISHFTAVGSAIAGIFAANRETEVPSLKAYKDMQPPTHQDILEQIDDLRDDIDVFDA
jgi:hypothetical protein